MVRILLGLAMLAGCVVDSSICGPDHPCPECASCEAGRCIATAPTDASGNDVRGDGGIRDGGPTGGDARSDCDGSRCGEGEGEGAAECEPGELLVEGACVEDPAEGEGEGEDPDDCGRLLPFIDADGDPRGIGDPCARAGQCPAGIVECVAGVVRCDTFPGGSIDASAPELCDQRDNDCDGVIDNGCDLDGDGFCALLSLGQEPPPEGQCPRGTEDCDDDNPNVFPGAEERCDNVDNNCDGIVDDNIEGIGEPCTEGLGACAREGVSECDPGTEALTCSAISGIARPEICGNGIDDDCNGEVDDGFVGLGMPCGECPRGQPSGSIICAVGGNATCCTAEPGCMPGVVGGDELCDEFDNDCDGAVDESFGDKGDPCTAGVGHCLSAGSMVCADSLLGTSCSATAGEPNVEGELCLNTIDDDCDGEVDEGAQQGEACTSGDGICEREGWTVCDPATRKVVCSARPADPLGAEACGNQLDDDCDGDVDEGFELGRACQVGFGACRAQGRLVCTEDGTSAVCSASSSNAHEERCGNRLDDDCDGEIDEGFDLGQPCEGGQGICRRVGSTRCNALGELVCDAEAAAPQREFCGNLLDDDCDGLADEGFFVGESCQSGSGICAREGSGFCDEQAPYDPACSAEPGTPDARGELCGDGADNDCDGDVDEGYDLGEPCTVGVGACLREGSLTCTPDMLGTTCDVVAGDPSPERCGSENDEDCDGVQDNGFDLGAPCVTGLGACARQGVTICSDDGSQASCNALAADPGVEICGNPIDEDCDGPIDEGFDFESDVAHCGACGQACALPNANVSCLQGRCVIESCQADFINADGDDDNGCEADRPQLRFLEPAPGELVSTPTTVRLFVSGVPIASTATIRLGGVDVGIARAPDYTLQIDTSVVPDGAGTLRASVDEAVLPLDAEVLVVVDNTQPIVRWVSPEANATFLGRQHFTAEVNADDDSGIAEVRVHLDDEAMPSAEQAPPRWRFDIDPTRVDPGDHELVATAVDEAGNESTARLSVALLFCEEQRWVGVDGFEIFAYEASRPDADNGEAGVETTFPCSRAGVLPWADLDRAEAAASCEVIGARLCTHDEWLRACRGPHLRQYPYGQAYEPLTCNGLNANVGAAAASGAFDDCISTEGVWDLSGNVSEWVSQGEDHDNEHVLGGSYGSGGAALRCSSVLSILSLNISSQVIGFRCCRN